MTSSEHSSAPEFNSRLERRRAFSTIFKNSCAILSWLCIGVLGFLLVHIFSSGWEWISFDFIKNAPSRMPHKAGLFSALMGTIWIIVTTAAIAIPVGVSSALYLEEYAKKNRLNSFIEINISNLAGVPSIVYGILGLTLFVRFMKLGPSVLSGALTLSLLILPVIIIASREAIKAVHDSMRSSTHIRDCSNHKNGGGFSDGSGKGQDYARHYSRHGRWKNMVEYRLELGRSQGKCREANRIWYGFDGFS